MKEYLYMIQACHTYGDVAYTVYANTEQQMQQEILDGLRDGFIMQVGKIEKEGKTNENN